jgi:hypothetical protein
LQARFVHGRTYEEGVSEYLQRVLVMMRRKQLPERFCEQAVETFGNPLTMADQRGLATAEAQKSLGLSEAQLVCLLFAPFVDNGAALEHFLRQCHPGMLVALPELHRAMQGGPAPEQVLQWMVDVSGLPVSLIGTLYRMRLVVRDEGRVPGTESGDAGVQVEDMDPENEAAVTGEWSMGQ